MTLLLASTCLPAQQPKPPTPEDKVLQYLERFNLTEHQILFLEREVFDRNRGQFAERLADLYAGELIRLVDTEGQKKADLNQRVAKLIKAYPKAETDSIRVLLLQSEFRDAAALADKWIEEPEQGAARDEAEKKLVKVAPLLVTLQDKLQEAKGDNPRLGEMAARASYFAGWSNYYLGLIKRTSGGGKDEFAAARKCFNRFFGIEPDDRLADNATAEGLTLDIAVRAKAVQGLVQTLIAAGDNEALAPWLRVLLEPATDPQVRDGVRPALLRAWLDAGDVPRAKAFAEKEVEQFSEGASSKGKLDLCHLLIRFAYGKDSKGKAEEKKELGALGLRGLIRMRRLDAATKLVEKYQIPIDQQSGFLLQWMQIQPLLVKAEKSKQAEDYAAAAKSLQAALAAPDAADELLLAAETRRTLGACLYRSGQHEGAAREFAAAAETLRKLKSPLAADTAWRHCQVRLNLAAKDPTQRDAAVRALEGLRRDYPEHPEARNADLHLGRLKQDLQALEAIPPQAPNYADACYELCRTWYNEWFNVRTNPDKAAEPLAKFKKRADAYLALPATEAEPRRRLQVLLWASEIALNSKLPELKQASLHLQKADALAASLPPSDGTLVPYRFFKLRFSQLMKDDAGVKQHADWLIEHGKDSSYERPALAVVAEDLHARIQQATGTERTTLLQQALDPYQRLVELTGTTAKHLQADRSARVACARLAGYAFELGKYDAAAPLYDRLLELEPNDRVFLPRSGLAHFHLKRYDRSLERWRAMLLAFKDTRPPEWYEAKYYSIACLAQVDRPRAKEAFAQYKLLHPELGPEAWRDRFQKLGEELRK